MSLDFIKPSMIHSTVFEDNNDALNLSESPKLTPRTNHIAFNYHWFKDQIGECKGIVLRKIESENQKADIFTKGLGDTLFARIRMLLQGVSTHYMYTAVVIPLAVYRRYRVNIP